MPKHSILTEKCNCYLLSLTLDMTNVSVSVCQSFLFAQAAGLELHKLISLLPGVEKQNSQLPTQRVARLRHGEKTVVLDDRLI